jgi:hypothetical protein
VHIACHRSREATALHTGELDKKIVNKKKKIVRGICIWRRQKKRVRDIYR